MPLSSTQPGVVYVKDSDAIAAAKDFGHARGWKGGRGGWIYDQDGRSMNQGWWNIWSDYKAMIRDQLTRELTVFHSFDQLVNAPGYRPTLRPKTWRERVLADCYDLWMIRVKDSRRTYRG